MKKPISYLILVSSCFISFTLRGSGLGDSILQQEHKTDVHNIEKIQVLLNKTIQLKKKDPASATSIAIDALMLTKSPEEDTLKLKVLYQLADLYIDQGYYRLAIKYQLTALEIAKSRKATETEGDLWNQLGVSYDLAGMWTEAGQAYIKALTIYKDQNDLLGIAYIYNNLGLVKTNLDEFLEADSFFQLSLDLGFVLANESVKAMAYSNLGLSKNAQGKHKEALDYFNKTLEIDLKETNPSNSYLGSDYNSIANCYVELGQYEKAEKLFAKSMNYKRLSQNERGISSLYIHMAEMYLKRKNAQLGLSYLDSAKVYAFKEYNTPLLLEIYKTGSNLYELNNEPSKALSETRKYIHLKDSLNIVETAQANLILEKEYTQDRAAQKMAELEHVLEHQKEIRKQWMIAAIALTLFILLILVQTRRLASNKRNLLINQIKLDELNENLKEKSIHLQEKHAALEEALSTKTRFLSVVSHEIRTPLHVVKGIAEILLAEDELNEEQKKKVQVLIQSSNQLNKLVDEIFDLNNLEAGNSDIRKESIQFKTWLDELFTPHQIQAKYKGLNAELVICEDAPDVVEADSRKLHQVLDNLLSNAVKFTDSGDITFKINVIEKDDIHSKIRFSVSDSGIGMDDETLKKVFEPFHQADFSMSRAKGGTGLGLSLSKGVLELLGGQIGVESNPGKGSTFYFDLVLKSQASKRLSSNTIQSKKFTWPEDKRLLIAEDHEQNILILKMLMNRVNAQADWAVNGLECYSKAMEEHYDLILMDLHMPIMDGKEAAERIRSLAAQRGDSVKIIGLTAANESEVSQLPIGLFDEVLYKPYRPDQLFKLMEEIVA